MNPLYIEYLLFSLDNNDDIKIYFLLRFMCCCVALIAIINTDL